MKKTAPQNLKKFIPRTIKTKRLILRKPRLSDAKEVFEYASDPEVTKYMTFKTYTKVSEAIPFIKKLLKEWKENTNYNWFITTKKSDKAMGNISLTIKKNKATFGYALVRKRWGKGYMSEALSAILNVAQKIPNVKLIWGFCDAANKGSTKVMQKAGLKYEKTVLSKKRVNLSDKIRKDKVFVLKKQ